MRRVGRSDFAAVQAPSVLAAGGASADAGKVGACIGFAHAYAEKRLSGTDSRQVEPALRFGAELENQRPALAVGDPMRRNRGTSGRHVFDEQRAGEGTQTSAALSRGYSSAKTDADDED